MKDRIQNYFNRIDSGDIDHKSLTVRHIDSDYYITISMEVDCDGKPRFLSNIPIGHDRIKFGAIEYPIQKFYIAIRKIRNKDLMEEGKGLIEEGNVFHMDGVDRFFKVFDEDGELYLREVKSTLVKTSVFDRQYHVDVNDAISEPLDVETKYGILRLKSDKKVVFRLFYKYAENILTVNMLEKF